LSDSQLKRIAELKQNMNQDIRQQIKDALQKGQSGFSNSDDYRRLRIERGQEAQEAICAVLVPTQLKRYHALERRSRLVQFGWDFVFRLMDRNPETRLSSETKRKLDTLLKERAEQFQEQSAQCFMDFIKGFDEILDESQVDVIGRMVGDGKYVVRPTIEEMIWQLNLDSDEKFEIERDRFALLRRNKLLALDGSVYDAKGGGGLNTGLLARDVILSAYAKIELEGDSIWFLKELSNPNGPYHSTMMKHFKEIEEAERRWQVGEITEQVKDDRITEARIEFDRFLWNNVMGNLIPGLQRQVHQHLVQLEIQASGFPIALTQGHLSRDVQLTPTQKKMLKRYYQITHEEWKKKSKDWTIKLEEEIRDLLTPEQVAFLKEELAAFDHDTIVFGTPMLVLLPRHMHF